jgi:serine/threonine protein phosphatase PrpC
MKKAAFFGKTDVGRVRKNNEDNFIVRNIWDKEHILAVVIDGVGGYEGGEVAAAIAGERILEYLDINTSGDCLELLKHAVIYANNCIYKERELKLELANMSCVLTASLVELNSMRVNMAHVGDTRLYQFSNGHIEKLSHDHSLVGYREEIGDLTEEEAMTHPQRNIISRDLGSSLLSESDNTYVEAASFPLDNMTQLMLCSDGLCDMVHSRKMSQILSCGSSVEEKVKKLIDAALDAGGRDNVTVVLVDIESDEYAVEIDPVDTAVYEPQGEKTAKRKSKWIFWCAPLLFVAGFAAGFFTRPLILTESACDIKISADSTFTVGPADTLKTSDKDSLQLSSAAENTDSHIHENVSNENNQRNH